MEKYLELISYVCLLCKKDFAQKHELANHLKTHYKVYQKVCENKYSCSVCKKVFASNISLRLHKNISSHCEESLSCRICEEKFLSNTATIEHMKRPITEGPNSCDIFEKRFSINNILFRHNTVHSSGSDTTTQSLQEYKNDDPALDTTTWSSQECKNDNPSRDTTTWSSQEHKNDNPARGTTAQSSQDTSTLSSQNTHTLLSQDTSNLLSQDTSTLLSQDTSTLLSQDTSTLLSQDTSTLSSQEYKNDNPARGNTTWSLQEHNYDNPARGKTTWSLQEHNYDNPARGKTTWSLQEHNYDNPARGKTTWSLLEHNYDNPARGKTTWSLLEHNYDNPARGKTTWSLLEHNYDNPARGKTTWSLQEHNYDKSARGKTTWSSQEYKYDDPSQETTAQSSQDTSTLSSQDTSTLLSQDISTLLSQDTSTLLSQDTSSLLSQDTSTLLSQDTSTLLSQDTSKMDKGKKESVKMCENLEGENQTVHHTVHTVYNDGSVYTVCNDSSAAEHEVTDCLQIKQPSQKLKQNKTCAYFCCTICKRAFCSKRNVARHAMVKHREKLPYTSTIYEKIDYVIKDDSEAHMGRKSGEKIFISTLYPKTFAHDMNSGNLKRLPVPQTLSYTCEVCKQDFALELELRNHMRIHTTASCRVGDKACLTDAVTSYPHLQEALSSSVCGKSRGEIYSCTVCQKAFSSRIHLKHHMSGHNVKEACSCSIGGNVFAPNMGMEDDSEKHKTDKPVSCCVSKDGFPVNTAIIQQLDGTNETSFLSHQLKTGNSVLCSLLISRGKNTEKCQKNYDLGTVNAKGLHVKSTKSVVRRQWYVCKDCKIGYAQKFEFKRHMKTHRSIFEKPVRMTKNVICKPCIGENFKVGRVCSLCGSDSSQYWCVEESEDHVMLCDQCLDVWVRCSICNKMMKFLNLKCHIWDHLG